MEPSVTGKAIRQHMGRIFEAITKSNQFVPASAVTGFKEWVCLSGMTSDEKRIVARASHDILAEIERRSRLVRQQLDSEVFRNGERK